MHDRLMVVLTLPNKNANAAKLEQQRRSRWRALMLCIKAKLESVASGIETCEEAFLAHVIVDDGQTVYDHVRPNLVEIAKTGAMVPLLPTHWG